MFFCSEERGLSGRWITSNFWKIILSSSWKNKDSQNRETVILVLFSCNENKKEHLIIRLSFHSFKEDFF